MKLASLFERRRYRAPSLRAELAAVRAGAKPLAMETWPAGQLDADHAAFVRAAHGLTIVERREGPLQVAYALRDPAEAWRIEALHALWRTARAYGWSDAAEALESHLLGYSARQVARWVAQKRHERLGWRGVTIYLLVPRRGAAERATAVWVDDAYVIKRRPPAWVARRGLAVARVAIEHAVWARWFGRGRGRLRTCVVAAAELPREIERLTARGWR